MNDNNFDAINIIGNDDDAGICGPDGCVIADHRKKSVKNDDSKD